MDAEIDVAQLMRDIRAEAARRNTEIEVFTEKMPAAPKPQAEAKGTGASVSNALPRFSLSAERRPRPDGPYTLAELLQYYDVEFLEHAYQALLKREPEQAAYDLYLTQLRSGRLDRLETLASLRFSPEGREKNVHIAGLYQPSLLRRLYNLPLLGYFFEWAVKVARLPHLLRQQRQFESRTEMRQQRIAAHLNHLAESIQESIDDSFCQLKEDIVRLAEIDLQLKAQLQSLHKQFETRAASIDEQLKLHMKGLSEQFEAQAIQFSQHAEQVAQRLQANRAELIQQEKRVLRLLAETHNPQSLHAEQQRPQPLTEHRQRLSDSFYAEFEEHFRGSRAEIIERLRVYLPYLRQAHVTGGVLDIGSGRGEWLELLGQEGIGARGVDTNSVQVEACMARGLEVAHSDALEFLRGLSDESLHAVTGFHIIEHLEFESLVMLLDEIMRTLVPQGLVIFETPNPENVSVTGHNFYVDPTHRRPLPIPMMKFLLEARGFCRIEVLKLHPSETPLVEGETDLIARFNDYFYGPMDYAIMGSKA